MCHVCVRARTRVYMCGVYIYIFSVYVCLRPMRVACTLAMFVYVCQSDCLSVVHVVLVAVSVVI